ncbi:MAG TPA: amidase [Ktedonobacteraceae bacterium]|jgi:aspartyl-tRNA(Asn)/glutamyl-tRNA(Gln) amidotransferase subunit A|nr:amidase [Ktedonobacteraceae bacterium]
MSRTPEIAFLSAVEARKAFQAKNLSPVELTQAVLERIDQHNQRYNAYCLVDAESAMAQARASEERWMRGEPFGKVDGIPIAIKDLILTRGWPTLRGSFAINPNQDWRDDDPSVERFRRSGAVLLGKTTTCELGWKGVTDSPLTGITRNPWNESLTSGGSSGGSAVAVVLGMTTLALGTDGGGSTRIPASFCGCVGLKPTFGRVPVWPTNPFGTLRHTGPMARTVEDIALMMDVIARPDARDWYALPDDSMNYSQALTGGVKGLRIAYIPQFGSVQVDPEVAVAVRGAAKAFENLGAHVEEMDAPFEDPLDLMATLWYTGAAQVVSGYGPEARAKMDPGLLETAADGSSYSLMRYLEVIMQRTNLGIRLSQFHEHFDLLLTPTLPIPAFEAGYEVPRGWPGRRWLTWTPFTYPFNLTQQPAISVPCGMTTSGLPIGLQLVGAKYKDALVLRAAQAYESAAPLHRRPPV